MLRTSSYTIYVDLPESRDEVLLIHGFTGAYDKVSRPVYRYLRSLSGRRSQEEGCAEPENGWQPRAETVETLARRGYLTAKSQEEEETLFAKLAEGLHERNRRYQPGYVILPTYSCNLRCPYCFQHHMRTETAYRHLLRTMAPEVIDRIFAALPAIEARHGLDPEGKRPRTFLFFGGEPLLAESRPTVEHVIRRGRELEGANFSAISNATELDAYRDLLGPGKIASLQVTLDGPAAEHDLRRVYADGAGSFARIADNITMALDLGVRISLRMNVDRTNVDWLPQLVDEIAALGWTSHPKFSFYLAPVHAAGAIAGESGTTYNTWELRRQLRALQQEHAPAGFVGHSDDTLHRRLRKLFEQRENPAPGFKTGFCGAQSVMYIFDAFGDIYACWEHTGDPRVRVGYVSEQGEPVMADEQERIWRSRSVLSNAACRRCRFAFYCGGGCASLARSNSGDFHSSHCDGFAQRFRATAAQAYLDFVSGKKPEEAPDPACDR